MTADTITAEMMAKPCDYCGAEPGEWCVTTGGHKASYLHAARWWTWKQGQGDE